MVTAKKEWGGAPGAIILRAGIGLSYFNRLSKMATRQVFRKMLSANSVNLCNFIQGPTLHFEDTKQRSTSPSIEIPAEPHNYWALGPDMSTNDIIKAVNGKA
jgi:hypothetical protein